MSTVQSAMLDYPCRGTLHGQDLPFSLARVGLQCFPGSYKSFEDMEMCMVLHAQGHAREKGYIEEPMAMDDMRELQGSTTTGRRRPWEFEMKCRRGTAH